MHKKLAFSHTLSHTHTPANTHTNTHLLTRTQKLLAVSHFCLDPLYRGWGDERGSWGISQTFHPSKHLLFSKSAICMCACMCAHVHVYCVRFKENAFQGGKVNPNLECISHTACVLPIGKHAHTRTKVSPVAPLSWSPHRHFQDCLVTSLRWKKVLILRSWMWNIKVAILQFPSEITTVQFWAKMSAKHCQEKLAVPPGSEL